MSKPTLILLPGQLCDDSLWIAQVAALADIAEIRVADLTLDDTVEAMEEPGNRFCVGVQWHPETDRDQGLFSALVAATRR